MYQIKKKFGRRIVENVLGGAATYLKYFKANKKKKTNVYLHNI